MKAIVLPAVSLAILCAGPGPAPGAAVKPSPVSTSLGTR